MERNDYLEHCKKNAAKKSVIVTYNGAKYYPYAYQLGYHSDGTVRHTAVLQDLNGGTIVFCRLQDVKNN